MNAVEVLHEKMRGCRKCLEAGHAIVPGAVMTGRIDAEVMSIGQAPGVTEVEARRPFNAGSGRRLFQWLGQAGWDETSYRSRQYMTSVTKCYPGRTGSGRGDRVPSKAEQSLCRPYLDEEIRLVNPRLIILVGGLAIKLFYPASLRLDQLIGTAAYFPPQTLVDPVNYQLRKARRVSAFDPSSPRTGRWIVPLPHPSGASLWPNKPENKALIDQAIAILHDVRIGLGLT